VLIFHVVRTNWSGEGKKLTTIVTPPLPGSSGLAYLDLNPWMSTEPPAKSKSVATARAAPPSAPRRQCHYELKSIVEHVGSSMTRGHYTNCSVDDDNNWWQFNDARVSRVSAAQVGATQAYLMAFERKEA
jgi:ubiquitin C-terminal hydrolase